ncbi:ribonuclease VapC [Sphingomonas vulcanisoli]|uniref:Ribonuclease VapC n=1 Tax=Sphingomonas vulcanisoli TaxID=1658060 RepID=A0ABX0TRU7_9SPHN|nr:type II toxin-antitoxin system VapC family toxin [Sphingomonas vulcanisoli]NIJ08181.1 ribonuclease VapC [Sphingomonas vulcanisoli]
MFIDASALVAIIAGETERNEMLAIIDQEPDSIWSPMSYWETVAALQSSHKMPITVARQEIENLATNALLRLVAIGPDELRVSLDAYERYGKGRHPARLNMGDCFAYACAKTNNARLLYKGDDFSKTDLA